MGIADRFKRSWEITKKTFAVMKHDKEILLFPVLSTIFSIILFLIFAFPILLSFLTQRGEQAPLFIYVGIFAFYFIVAFTATFFNAGIVHIAKTRFEGGDATFMDGIKVGFKHFRQILGWALLSATVGLILNILQSQARERKGIVGLISRVIVSLIGIAWAIVSIFVVPSIVIKGHGPFKALKSSALTVKKTWGESLIKYYGLGFARGIIILIGSVFLLIPGILIAVAGALSGGLILIGIYVLFVVIVSVIFSSANTIFDTALFMYADTGKVPEFYSKEEMSHAFTPGKK